MNETIEQIREHHRVDRFAIKQQQRVDRALESFVVFNVVGLPHGADDKERKQAWLKAKKMIGDASDPLSIDQVRHASPITDIVSATESARQPWDAVRSAHERAMVKLVRSLPIEPWRATVRGLGELSLARIIGEAGNLSNYPDKSKLWKRMGLAVMNGQRQGNPGKGASADDWIAHGYKAERRSVMFVIGENLIRLKSEPYYAKYVERKAFEIERGITKAHAHNRAKRYIEKKLLADLWRAWRQVDQEGFADKAASKMSPSAEPIEQKANFVVPNVACIAVPTAQSHEPEALRALPLPASSRVPKAHPIDGEARNVVAEQVLAGMPIRQSNREGAPAP